MIRIAPDLETLSFQAAEAFVQQASLSVKERDRFCVALAGGRTPRRFYEMLSEPTFRDNVDWKRTHVFWGDERCVPAGDERHNALMARRAFLDHVPIPSDQIHPILCRQAPERSAAQLAKLLRDFFTGGQPVFDLILLGLGEDAHTASLFPGSEILSDQTAWTAAAHRESEDMYRVTLMPAVLNQARCIMFLVSGEGKANAVKEVLEGPHSPFNYPAQLIRPRNGELLWLIDEAAAGGLRF